MSDEAGRMTQTLGFDVHDPIDDVRRLAELNLRSLDAQYDNALNEEREARELVETWHQKAIEYGKACDRLRTFIREHFPQKQVDQTPGGDR